jgi:tRNA (cytidine/uridine-2'-O-)-methyltransferase
MFNVILFEPEIPPNTGNVIRLCANTGAALHLVKPLGFRLDARALRRAGLDYQALATVHVHSDFETCLAALPAARLFAIETPGQRLYSEVRYREGDALLFGAESRGLPEGVLRRVGADNVLRIPMLAGNRSLNLSNSVAVVLYEAWRQLGFRQVGSELNSDPHR